MCVLCRSWRELSFDWNADEVSRKTTKRERKYKTRERKYNTIHEKRKKIQAPRMNNTDDTRELENEHTLQKLVGQDLERVARREPPRRAVVILPVPEKTSDDLRRY